MSSRFYLLCAILIAVTVYYRFNRNAQEIPEGCDVFGFLHMSEAISSGQLFEEHTNRPFLPALINHLEELGYVYQDYAWVLAPHAYHVEKHNSKIINQYPPGTSLILSVFPKDRRQAAFSMIAIMMMVLIPGLLIHRLIQDINERNSAYALIFLLVAFSVITGPMLTEFTKVNSVAPTFGLLLAAGLVYEKKPRWAIFLVSLTILFRIANVLLIPPMFIYAVLGNHKINFKDLSVYTGRGLKAFAAFFLSGFGLYIIYVFILLGNPLYPTYSEIDRRSIGADVLFDNLYYYFIENAAWFYMTLLALSGIIILFIQKKIKPTLFWSLLSMPVIIYTFFIFHYIKTPYYPYAASVFIFGYLIVNLSALTQKYLSAQRIIVISCISVFAVIGIKESINYFDNTPMPLQQQEEVYRQAFAEEQVVWAELKSSTVEYATGIPGMRIHWGQPKIVVDIMKWFWNNGHNQAILVSDLDLTAHELEALLTEKGISYKKEENSELGIIFRIRPD